MARFVTGQELEKVIYDIIWEVEETLIVVSPFIKLDDYFKKLFDKHLNNPKIHFIIIFGKNEGAASRSLSKSDFDFFKKFLNVSIIYIPNLHAKYYGNEKNGVITSVNLYDYSFINNIEFGVYSEGNVLNKFAPNIDFQAWQTCLKMAETNEVVFIKRPVYEKRLFSSILGKHYVKSDILFDITDKFYSAFSSSFKNKEIKKLSDFVSELELGSAPSNRPSREEVENTIKIKEEKKSSNVMYNVLYGYCIRTGEKIPFNPNHPFCDKAFKSWAQFGNKDYPEVYCHKTGKPSNGKTSMRNPILY